MTDVLLDQFPANVLVPRQADESRQTRYTKVRATLTDTGLLWIVSEPGELLATFESIELVDRRGQDPETGGRAVVLWSRDLAVTITVANAQGCGCTGSPSRDTVLGLLG